MKKQLQLLRRPDIIRIIILGVLLWIAAVVGFNRELEQRIDEHRALDAHEVSRRRAARIELRLDSLKTRLDSLESAHDGK